MSQSSTEAAVTPLRAAAAAVAALQGLALIANGVAVAWTVIRDGIDGPTPVASPTGVVVEVVLYLLFGAALLWIARGLLRSSPFVTTPFLLAQLLGLAVAFPLALGGGAAGVIGWLITISCAVGLVAWVGLLRGRPEASAQ